MDLFNTMSWGDIVENEEKGIYIVAPEAPLAQVAQVAPLDNSLSHLTNTYYNNLINNNNIIKDYLITNKDYITKIIYTQAPRMPQPQMKTKNYNTILELFSKIFNIFNTNKFDFITKDKLYEYTFIDLDIIWIEKNIVDLLHKISKDLNYAIIIENKLNKYKSLLIIKSDEQRLKKLRYNYASKRILPF